MRQNNSVYYTGASESCIQISDDVEDNLEEDVDEIAAGIVEAQINDHGMAFSTVLCISNVDGKTHGVVRNCNFFNVICTKTHQ